MSEELFSASEVESKSPKLKWKEKHGVITIFNPSEQAWYAGFQAWHPSRQGVDFFFHEESANGDSRLGIGCEEDDAIDDLLKCRYARNLGTKLWNEES